MIQAPEKRNAHWALLVLAGLLIILAVAGRALYPDRTLLPLDLIHEAYLPWANDVSYPGFADHYSVDAVHEYLPLFSFHAGELSKGRLPTWNPYNRGGSPYLENPIRLPFHPVRFLLRWIPVDQVVDIAAVLHFTLAFLAMAAYLKHRGLRLPAVFLGGLCFSLSSYFVFNILHERNVAALSLLPLALLYLERTAGRGRWRDVGIFAAILGVTLLMAGPAVMFLFLLVFATRLGGLLAWETRPSVSTAIGKTALAGAIACLLAAPNLLSILHGLVNNIRLFDYAGEYSLDGGIITAIGGYLGLLIAAIHPYLVGSRESLDLLKPFNQTIRLMPFAGSFALIFVCFSAGRLWKDAANRWLLVLLAVALVLLFPPLTNTLSQRSVVLLLLFIVLTSAIGFDRFWSTGREALRGPAKWLLATVALAWGLFAAIEIVLQFFGGAITEMIEGIIRRQLPGYLFERYADWKLDAAARFIAIHRISSTPNLLFLGGLTLIGIAVYRFSRSGKQVYKGVVFAITAAAPVLFALDNLSLIDNRAYPIPEKPVYLDTLDRGVEKRRTWIASENLHDRLLLPKNLPDLFGIRQVQGYGSIIPINPSILLHDLALEHPLFEIAGVNYLIAARDSGFRSVAFPRQIHAGEVNIYSRSEPASRFHVTSRLAHADSRETALQRARDDNRLPGVRYHYLSGLPPEYTGEKDIQSDILVTRDNTRRIELSVTLSAGGLLVLADTWYPGWQAHVNSEHAEILAVDGALRGIWLEAGDNEVVFEYHHWPSRAGLAAQLAGVVTLLLLFAIVFRRSYTNHPKV